MRPKPWDARLATLLVAPLAGTFVTPNHFTTLRLLTGLASAWLFAAGESPNLAAWLYVLSMFLDHTDGELARISGRCTRLGHLYDLVCDFVVNTALFVCIGVGLSHGALGPAAILLGTVAGLAIATMFFVRHEMEERLGKSATRQPGLAGFEPEDALYVLPAITYAGALGPFLVVSALGATIACALVGRAYLRSRPAA